MEEEMEPTPVFLPEKLHGQRSLVGYSPWVVKIRNDWALDSIPLSIYISFIKCLGYINEHNKQAETFISSHSESVQYHGENKK